MDLEPVKLKLTRSFETAGGTYPATEPHTSEESKRE